jgi:hypothetical protein
MVQEPPWEVLEVVVWWQEDSNIPARIIMPNIVFFIVFIFG